MQFICAKAIAPYALGSKKEEDIPDFFLGKTKTEIEEFRRTHENLDGLSSKIINRFNKLISDEPIKGDFLTRSLEGFDEEDQKIIYKLFAISFSELQGRLLKSCTPIAIEKLEN